MKISFRKKMILMIIAISLLSIYSCKVAFSVQLYDIWGVAIKVKGEDKSNFSAYVNIFNDTPELEGMIVEWNFKIFSGDELLIDIDNNNYKNLGFEATVSLPAPNYYNGGNLVILFGIPVYKPGTLFVDTDIYKGKRPTKFDFYCGIKDIRGDITRLESLGVAIEYLEHIPE